MNLMKTALFSLLAATFVGLVSTASGAFDAAHFISALLAAGLVAWTIESYSRKPRPLTKARPTRLPAPLSSPVSRPRLIKPVRQLAA